ncbi:hypothetical protein [Streptomyces fulvorobeus]|uniref:Uncharacterized protein n=1 Tax=Streptomyces fulvorobeus TaxID=284028 RepID=A0A7J0CFF6_9ACTN|nr:hypothetical protein [Streptomyces fulvorobeus]NYE44589.1 hypothetical protein [Streptomyces fulvorobeus]GFN01129.1 hypothetical protein Sfulv_59390 [Streptomyces fulvorobeus]
MIEDDAGGRERVGEQRDGDVAGAVEMEGFFPDALHRPGRAAVLYGLGLEPLASGCVAMPVRAVDSTTTA